MKTQKGGQGITFMSIRMYYKNFWESCSIVVEFHEEYSQIADMVLFMEKKARKQKQ